VFPLIPRLRRTACGVPDGSRFAPLDPGYPHNRYTDIQREVRGMSGTDKLTNKIEEVSGKGKQAVGDATDDRDLQAEGRKEESKSNLKQAGEKVKDAFK
jgi:uncharacterized protein YjbJ (UPF0337 family)